MALPAEKPQPSGVSRSGPRRRWTGEEKWRLHHPHDMPSYPFMPSPTSANSSTGDRINAVLATAGYTFSLLLRWLAALLCALIKMLDRAIRQSQGA